MGFMGKFLVIGALAVGLAGCGLPPSIQIASWAIDGISVIVSGKSVGDHALSVVAAEDCAMWRIVKGDSVCRAEDAGDPEPGDVVVAASSYEGPAEIVAVNSDRARRFEADEERVFLTELGDAFAESEPALQVAAIRPASLVAANRLIDLKPVIAGGVEVVASPKPGPGDSWKLARAPILAPGAVTAEAAAYLVIGSFRDRRNAERRRDSHARLATAVIPVSVDDTLYFRVLAGPFDHRRLGGVRARLAASGIVDAWRLNICAGGRELPPCTAFAEVVAAR